MNKDWFRFFFFAWIEWASWFLSCVRHSYLLTCDIYLCKLIPLKWWINGLVRVKQRYSFVSTFIRIVTDCSIHIERNYVNLNATRRLTSKLAAKNTKTYVICAEISYCVPSHSLAYFVPRFFFFFSSINERRMRQTSS